MSQSLSQLYVHLVFSTKDRAPVLHPEISERLHDYLAGIFDEIDSHSLKIGSATDHVHSLFALSKNLALCKAVEEHHRRRTFQDEYRRFLQKYQVAYDERYVWD